MPALAIVSVILRYQARLVKRSRFGADDYAILVALVCYRNSSSFQSSFAESNQILAIGLALSTLLGKRFNLNAFLSLNVLLMFLAGSKLGNLGGHQRQTAEGLPIIGEEYKHFTKVGLSRNVATTRLSLGIFFKGQLCRSTVMVSLRRCY